LNIAAMPLRFLGYLMEDAVTTVALDGVASLGEQESTSAG
jgi:hypothetical protein